MNKYTSQQGQHLEHPHNQSFVYTPVIYYPLRKLYQYNHFVLALPLKIPYYGMKMIPSNIFL